MVRGNDDILFSATLTPHRSLGRRAFLILIAVIAGFSFAAGLFFFTLGAWPVIGFMGLDVLAVWLAFRLNYRAGRSYEEIAVSRSALIVRKVNPGGRVQEISFNPQWVRLEVEEDALRGVTRVAIRSREMRVPLGGFLNPDDRKSFARALGGALAEARS